MPIDRSVLEEPWDVVVVGHGAAGLSAAAAFIEAYQGDSPRVAILDRQPYDGRGGSTAWTTAGFRIDDSAQLRADWGQIVQETAGHEVSDGYIEALYEHASETLNWIRKRGVRVVRSGVSMPGMNGRHGYSIEGGGRSFVNAFTQLVTSQGVVGVYGPEALQLLRDGQGPVSGVRVRVDGEEIDLAARVVVLACGGFEGNRALLEEHIPGGSRLDTVAPGSRVNTGSGIAMARAVGAATAGQYDGAHMEPVDPRSPNPEALINSWMFGILVDRDGNRFVDEASTTFDLLFDYVANAVHRAAGGIAFAINDSSVLEVMPGLRQLNWTSEPAIVADTLEELAALIGVDPAGLLKTVAEFNASTSGAPLDPAVLDGRSTTGIEPRKSNWAAPLTSGPYEAWPIVPHICFTYYGLKVDKDARVLDASGMPISGLYAAGEITGLFHHTYPSGTSVLRSLTFGRLAGLHIAQQLGSSPGA